MTHNINQDASEVRSRRPKRVTTLAHLSLEELERGYRQANLPKKADTLPDNLVVSLHVHRRKKW